MNWFKENKFVAGVLVVTVLGAGGLGYMMFDARHKYDANAEAFQTQASELKRLETSPAYPDKENLQVSEDQRVLHQTMIADLQKSLAAAQFPTEALAPNQFQDQLKAAVTQLSGKTGKMALPKGFYYGFESYQTTLPNQDVTPLLGRELKAIQLLFQIVLDKGKGRVQSVGDFKREPLPEESNKKPEAPKATPKPGPAKPGQKPGAAPAEPLVKPHSVDLVFTAEQRAVAEILNELAANKQQFFIIRYVALRNTNDRPPPREATLVADPNAPAPAAPDPNAPAPAAGSPEAPTKDPIILGNERVEVTLRVEIVDIAPPKLEATPAPKARSAGK